MSSVKRRVKKPAETRKAKPVESTEETEAEDYRIDFDWVAYWENDWQKDVGHK